MPLPTDGFAPLLTALEAGSLRYFGDQNAILKPVARMKRPVLGPVATARNRCGPRIPRIPQGVQSSSVDTGRAGSAPTIRPAGIPSNQLIL